MNNNYKKGIIFAVITALISGLSIFYNKQILITGVDPLILNILKNGGAAIILSLLLITGKPKQNIFKLKKAEWVKLLSIAIIGGSIPFLLYFEGLKSVSAINANLIHKSLFIWVAILALPFLGEKLNLLQVTGYIILVWGNLLFGGINNINVGKGEILIFSATLLWSLENIIAKKMLKNIDSKIVGWARMFIGVLLLTAFVITNNKLHLIFGLNPKYIIPIAGSALFLAIYVSCYFKALKYTPATLVTSILILGTPVTNILNSLFILHNIPQSTLISALISVIGIMLIIPLVKQWNLLKK
jgi:drug/metabolite transporter (DMT)-like permease